MVGYIRPVGGLHLEISCLLNYVLPITGSVLLHLKCFKVIQGHIALSAPIESCRLEVAGFLELKLTINERYFIK